MTHLQYAAKTDVKASSVNLHEEDPERPFSRGNAASQRFHHTREEGSPRVSNLDIGDTPQSRTSMQASPMASSNLPENHLTSTNNSQSTANTGTTPPTSSSAPSSQNNPPPIDRRTQLNTMSEAKTTAQAGVLSRTVHAESQANALHIHTTPTSPTTADFAVQAPGHSQKRTANGQTKPSSSSLPTSPVEGAGRCHSRNTSVNSSGTQIGEVGLASVIDEIMGC